jgi:2-(1,2-epoxy-1,2-dihydrophenyl)acetyl-CoA isomerase
MEQFFIQKYEHMDVELDGHKLWIYFNRDDARNAFSEIMVSEFTSILLAADQDPSIRVMILSGRGRAFNAGGDIKSMQDNSGMFAGAPNELRMRYKFGIQTIPQVMDSLSTPIIAMINGAAIGAGLDVSCMCDIRIASEDAKFGETFNKLSLVPGDGGCYFLQRVVGFSKAMELTLTADIISANEALNIGLVSKVVAADILKEEAFKLADKIEKNGPVAVGMSKRALVHAYKNDLSSILEMLCAFQGISQRTDDHQNALGNLNKNGNTVFKNK